MEEEIWKIVEELSSDDTKLEASNKGRVRITKILLQSDNGNGYKSINVNRNKLYVHRCVMKAFYPLSDDKNMQVNHKDFNKSNNNLDNLEWVTPLENLLHKLADEKRREKTRIKLREIQLERLSRGTSGIQNLTEEQKKKSWITRKNNYSPDKHCYFGKYGQNSPRHAFTNEQVLEIRNKYENQGITTNELAEDYKVSYQTIRDLVKYKTYKDAGKEEVA